MAFRSSRPALIVLFFKYTFEMTRKWLKVVEMRIPFNFLPKRTKEAPPEFRRLSFLSHEMHKESSR
jgi:hypothetical protein